MIDAMGERAPYVQRCVYRNRVRVYYYRVQSAYRLAARLASSTGRSGRALEGRAGIVICTCMYITVTGMYGRMHYICFIKE